jgi:glucose dehydrogenase
VDTANGTVFFSTGDCQRDATPPYHEALIALDATTGLAHWTYRPRNGDTCDFDFGASPNLIDYKGHHYVLESAEFSATF